MHHQGQVRETYQRLAFTVRVEPIYYQRLALGVAYRASRLLIDLGFQFGARWSINN
jgi:hypothetical protein